MTIEIIVELLADFAVERVDFRVEDHAREPVEHHGVEDRVVLVRTLVARYHFIVVNFVHAG